MLNHRMPAARAAGIALIWAGVASIFGGWLLSFSVPGAILWALGPPAIALGVGLRYGLHPLAVTSMTAAGIALSYWFLTPLWQ